MIRRDRFLDYVDRFRGARVLVVGPAVVEIDVHCAVSRLAPDRAMPVYHCERRTIHPGAAALTAATIANLGGRPTLLAPIGHGRAAEALRSVLSELHVELIDAGDERCATPELFRYLAHGRQLMQIRRGWSAACSASSESCSARDAACGFADDQFQSICLVDAEPAAIGAADLDRLAERARSHNIPLIFDAAGADFVPPAGRVDHLIVNERESRLIAAAHGINEPDDHIERLRSLCSAVAPTILLTLGRHGAVVGHSTEHGLPARANASSESHGLEGGPQSHWNATGDPAHAPALEINPITPPVHALADRRGVGYVLSGVYSLTIAVGAPPEEAAFLACSGASFAASTPGPKRLGIDDLLRIAFREIESHVADGIEVFSRIREEHLPVIDRAARLLMEAYTQGRQVLVFGNGGSAAEANHLVGELTGRFKNDRPGLPAISLSANDSLTTCLANDYGFDDVFARQIDTFCREGDVVIGLSTSGRSVNVIRAMERARQRGARAIAFTGADPGPLGEVADVVISVPSNTTARIQEAHLFVIHVLCDMLDARLDPAGRLHPTASEM